MLKKWKLYRDSAKVNSIVDSDQPLKKNVMKRYRMITYSTFGLKSRREQ